LLQGLVVCQNMSSEPYLINASFENSEEAIDYFHRLHGDRFLFPVGKTLDISFSQQTIGDMALWSAASTSGFEFYTPDCCRPYFLFVTPKRGAISAKSGQHVLAIKPEQAFIKNLQEVDALERSAELSELAFGFPQESIYKALSCMIGYEASESIRFDKTIDLTVGVGLQISQLLKGVADGLGNGDVISSYPLAAKRLSDTFLDFLIQAVPNSYHDKIQNAGLLREIPSRHLRDVLDYIEAHLHLMITVTDIAGAIGVTPRALQHGFRRYFNCTPMEYVQQRRLDKVRGELQVGGPGVRVKDVALRWGFFHLGRFAAAYEARFGERPSQTLRR
jgi:AraC-like DNA-binding protein